MVISRSVQYNGGFLPDIILLTQGYYHRGTRLIPCSGFVFIAYVIVYYYYHVWWCTTTTLSLFCFY